MFFGKKKSGSKNSGSQDPSVQPSLRPPSPQQGYPVHPSPQQQGYPLHPSPQTPGDDFFQNLLAMGMSSSPQQVLYPYAGSPGGLPFGVSSQFAHFQPYGTPRATTPRPLSIPTHDDAYRPDIVQNLFNTPGSTPGSDGSSYVPVTALSSDEVSDVAPRRSSATRRGKEKTVDTSGSDKAKRPRSTYSEAESRLIAECWADVSQDAEIGTNQTELMFWSRVHQTYNENRRPGMKDHSPEQIRRHWERLMKECGHFNDIYTNLMNEAGSGQTEPSVRKEAYSRYNAQYNITHGFKWWGIYEILKDLPKFRREMHKALQQRLVKPRLSTDGDYSRGPEPIDLNEDHPPPQCPMGNMKTKEMKKGKGKAKAGECFGPAYDETEEYMFMGNAKTVAHMWTLYLQLGNTKKQKSKLWKTMNAMKKKMGLIDEDESEPDNE